MSPFSLLLCIITVFVFFFEKKHIESSELHTEENTEDYTARVCLPLDFTLRTMLLLGGMYKNTVEENLPLYSLPYPWDP
jgi:hypothetical protein